MCAWSLALGRPSPGLCKPAPTLWGGQLRNRSTITAVSKKRSLLGHENSRLAQPFEVLTHPSSFKQRDPGEQILKGAEQKKRVRGQLSSLLEFSLHNISRVLDGPRGRFSFRCLKILGTWEDTSLSETYEQYQSVRAKRTGTLFCSLLSSQHLEQYRANSRTSLNVN